MAAVAAAAIKDLRGPGSAKRYTGVNSALLLGAGRNSEGKGPLLFSDVT